MTYDTWKSTEPDEQEHPPDLPGDDLLDSIAYDAAVLRRLMLSEWTETNIVDINEQTDRVLDQLKVYFRGTTEGEQK